MIKKIAAILVPVFVCFLVGFISQRFQVESIATWYPLLNKSPLNPPNIAFPIAWSILYLCMGISIGLVMLSDNSKKKSVAALFAVQLFFNFTWSIAFFYFQNPLLGLVNIVLLVLLIAFYIFKTYRWARLSSLLFVPYLLWVGFATYLNLYIYLYNG